MPDRHVPVRPVLERLREQAKELHLGVRTGEPQAVAEFVRNHPRPVEPAGATLADAQLALARAYGVSSWQRLALACRLIAAIWADDADTVRVLVEKHPRLLREDARGVRGNWGPPMSYAANLGRTDLVEMLRSLGAEDVQYAFDRACLQSQIETARALYAMGARPQRDAAMGPAETLSSKGFEFLRELGVALTDDDGDRLAPVALVLETYSRGPSKHACLEGFVRDGVELPDTAPMAVHRGRIDLLEALVTRDRGLLERTFTHEEIFPPELGCHADASLALHGTPLAGGTLLHMCVDYDELEMLTWLLDHGASADARAAIDADGFGGHTALFGTVVSQPFRTSLRCDDAVARLLLDRGASPNARASLRKRLRFVDDETEHLYRDVTPLAWGEHFHDQDWVSRSAMALIAERGGTI